MTHPGTRLKIDGGLNILFLQNNNVSRIRPLRILIEDDLYAYSFSNFVSKKLKTISTTLSKAPSNV
jgi:hypothetical protein